MTSRSAWIRLAAILAVLLLATAVVESLGLTWTVRVGLARGLAVAGALLLAIAGHRPARSRGEVWIESVLWLGAAAIVPGSWRVVALIAAPATLLADFGRPMVLRRGSGGVRDAARIVVATALAVDLVLPILLRNQPTGWLAHPLAGTLAALGVQAAAWSEGVAIETLHGSPDLPAAGSLFAAPLAIALMVATVVRVVEERPDSPLRFALRAVVATVVASFVSTVFAVLLLIQIEKLMPVEGLEKPMALLYAPAWRALLAGIVWVPLMMGTSASRGRDLAPATGRSSPVKTPAGRAWWMWALALLTALGGWGLFFEEGGVRKPGRLMIDEGHSEWETVSPAYDPDWYGFDSGYNYASIAAFLAHHYRVDANHAPLTPERLGGVDVLILKTPTRAYSTAEREAVLDFVRRGGGLFLVGEHTNVWGSGTYLNALARPLGFEFRYDVVFDLRKRFEEVHATPRLGGNPMTGGLDRFLFAVSCSVRPDALSVRPVMWQGGLWSLDIDYAVSNFYPQPNLGWRARVGPHVQCVTRHVGKGRVVGFTDSTVWSNFCALLPGKPELLLGILEWLDRRNRWFDPLNAARLLLWVVALAALVATARRRMNLGVAVALLLTSVAVGARLAGIANAAAYRAPRPDASLVAIEFLDDPAVYDIGSWGFIEDVERSYSIFYQWTLRLGMFPRVREAHDPPLPGARLAVAVEDSTASRSTEEWVRDRVRRNVPVLLMLRAGARPERLQWLHDLGVDVDADSTTEERSLTVDGASAHWPLRWVTRHRMRAAEILLSGPRGEPILARGRGSLYVLAGAECFTDGWMGGDQGNVPDADLRRHFELEFSIVRGLAGGNLRGELAAGASRTLRVVSGGAATRGPMDQPGVRGHGEPDRAATP